MEDGLPPTPGPHRAWLIVLAGLPGVGKTTLARAVARRSGAAHVRVDTIEQAMVRSGVEDPGTAGYVVAYAIAADNLRLGLSVVSDSVNPVAASRRAWAAVGEQHAVGFRFVEVICSDEAEHRKRLQSRKPDIPGHRLPTWDAVRAMRYEPMEVAALLIDSARMSVDEAVQRILDEACNPEAQT